MSARKRVAHATFTSHNDRVGLTDDFGGVGWVQVQPKSQNFIPNPVPRPPYPGSGYGSAAYQAYYNWQHGTYEYWDYVVQGVDAADQYHPSFALRDYGNGLVLPASLDAATKFKTLAEAAALAERWMAAGCPGMLRDRTPGPTSPHPGRPWRTLPFAGSAIEKRPLNAVSPAVADLARSSPPPHVRRGFLFAASGLPLVGRDHHHRASMKMLARA